MLKKRFLKLGEFAASGLYEEPDRSLFYRKALGIRRFFENCDLAEYNGKPLYPSGIISQKMSVSTGYMTGLTFGNFKYKESDPELYKCLSDDFCRYHSTVPKDHTVTGNMYTHSMPNYERILSEGLLSYIGRIEKIEDDDMREGLLHVVAGIRRYIERCTDYLKSVSADEKLINALQKVPLYPAETIYEAILSWNFVLYLDNCDNLGCLANGLRPYYNGEDIVPLLENLYDNLDINNGYSMAMNSDCPSLTVQCLKAAHGRRRPMIELLVDNATPEEVWTAAFETIRTGGQPAFYNRKTLFDSLQKRFPNVRDEDIQHFCGGGCTETMFTGLSNVGSVDAGIHLLMILEDILHSSLTFESFENLYFTFISQVGKTADTVMKEISNSRELRAKYNPLPMRTLFVDDCIANQTEFNAGGARYGWSIINFAGLINTIDSLLSIKTLVYDEKKYTLKQLVELLDKDDDAFLRECISLPLSYGRDIDEVNEFSHRLSHDLFTMTERGTLLFGEGFLSASIQFQTQAAAGKRIGATPDGRHKATPLCDSLAAIFGKDSDGPTALLNSITALDLKNALGTPVVSFNLPSQFDDDILKALILGYINNDGIQLQITYASKKELLDAYENPHLHDNLIVRVGGYSEYFNRLPDDLKRMIINRTIQSEGVM